MKQNLLNSLRLRLCMLVALFCTLSTSVLAADETITFSSLYSSNTILDGTAIKGTDFSVTFNKRSGGTATQYYTNGTAVRWYGGGTLVVASTTKTIEKIEITYTRTDNTISANVGDWSNNTWTGSSESVTFTQSGTSGHLRISAIAVTYSSGGSTTPSISADDVNIAYNSTSGSIAYTINNGVTGGSITSATVTSSNPSNWLAVSNTLTSPIGLTCLANDAAASKTATVRLTYTYNTNETVTKDVTVTQAGNPDAVDNIEDISAVSTSYTVRGTVVATNARGFVIGDGTGYVYTYLGNNPSSIPSVEDKVKISGTTGTYGQILQFTSTATIEEATTSNYNNTPAVTILDAEGMAAYNNSNVYKLSNYVQFEGTLSSTTSGNTTYYDIAVVTGNTTSTARISYPTSAQTTALSNLVNKTVRVKGYFAGFSSTYFTVMMESVEEVTDPTITTGSNSLTGFTYVEGNGPSAAQTVSVSGSDLTANISLSLGDNSNYEMCLTENGTYTNSLTLTQSNGSVSATNVYVRLKAGLAKNANYAGTITLTSTDATTKTVSLSGSVTGQTYAISVENQITGGSIEADLATAEEGATVTLTAHPDAAYNFTSWTVYEDDLETEVTVTNNQFTMPACEVYVTATFTSKPTYVVTCAASPVAGGTISALPESAYEGQTVELTVNPAEGYTLSSVVITKTSDGSATDITVTNNAFTMPAYAVTATATFEVSLERTLTIDFESAANSYSDWTFTNMTSQQTGNANVSGHNSSTYYGTTGGTQTASIETKSTIANPVSLTCYVSKQTTNTTSSTWYIQVKTTEANAEWENVKNQSATSMSPGTWVEFSADLSSYSDVYVRVYYNGSTAIRNIDDLTLTYEIDPSAASITTEPTSVNLNADSHNGSISVTWTNVSSGQSVYWCDANGDAASYDWITASINGTTHNVDYTVSENTTGAARTAYLKVHGLDGSSADVYSSLVTINQSKPTIAYTLVSSLTPGKKYIIASGSEGSVKVLGSQGSNNRAAVTIVNEVNNGVIEIEDEDIAEFVVYGPDANGFYTLSDGTSYLYANGTDKNNYLKSQTTNSSYGKWDITIDSETKAATVEGQGGNSNKYMRFNSTLFSCYGSGSSIVAPVYFYEKADAAVTTTAPVTLNSFGYATFASTNALDFLDADNANYSAWKISSISGENITFNQIKETTVEAGTGILLKGTASTPINLNILPVGGLHYNAEDNLLVGTTDDFEVANDGDYYGLSGRTFVKVKAGTVPAGKALLPVSALGGSSSIRTFTFVFENPTTGISEVQNVSAEEFGAIFNLAGQRMSKPRKGVNIINGKRVLVK